MVNWFLVAWTGQRGTLTKLVIPGRSSVQMVLLGGTISPLLQICVYFAPIWMSGFQSVLGAWVSLQVCQATLQKEEHFIQKCAVQT